MPMTCRYCLQDDLPDGALKCRHCGSWTNPDRAGDEIETFRRTLREELRNDLKDHRGFVEASLSQLKAVAAVIVAAGLAAAVFFGIRTDQSISDTAARIASDAEAQIRTATASVQTAAADRVTKAVEAHLAAPEMAALIETTLADAVSTTVTAEVTARFDAVSAEVAAQINASEDKLAALNPRLDELDALSTKALARLKPIEASFGETKRQTVAGSQSILPIEPARVEGKGDPSEIEAMVTGGVNALSFTLGGGYDGPVAWKYFDRLLSSPRFRYVVFLDGGTFVGLVDARDLARALDPPDTGALHAELGRDPYALPIPDQVPGWSRFADDIGARRLDVVASLPSFVPASAAVRSDWTSISALDHMERSGLERLPVVAPDGTFAGVIERSRLTTRVLLELAGAPGP